MAKLRSGTRIYGTAGIDTSLTVGSGVTITTTSISATNINSTGVSTITTLNATSLVGVTTAGITTVYTNSVNDGPISGARNRIMNGDMRIDQRNAGVSVTYPGSGSVGSELYVIDRWNGNSTGSTRFSMQRSGVVPVGFTSSLLITTTTSGTPGASDFCYMSQYIEGFNIADLNYGTSNAVTTTLSFWTRSSLTGAFGGSLSNSAGNRSYAFSFTINSANTWEYKNITIPGDTTGTWLTDSGRGLCLKFDLGSGSSNKSTANTWTAASLVSPTGSVNLVATNGATLYFTGVQLEPGTVATTFERRSYGQELALCQRYYQHQVPTWGTPRSGDNYIHSMGFFKVTMRISPVLTQAYNTYGQTISIQTSNADYYVTGASGSSGTSLNAGYNASADL